MGQSYWQGVGAHRRHDIVDDDLVDVDVVDGHKLLDDGLLHIGRSVD